MIIKKVDPITLVKQWQRNQLRLASKDMLTHQEVLDLGYVFLQAEGQPDILRFGKMLDGYFMEISHIHIPNGFVDLIE